MNKEFSPRFAEYKEFATSLAGTFIQRWDMYARQLDDGSYRCIHKPLSDRHIISHLKGEITLGVYVLDVESQARYVVFDADSYQVMEQLKNVSKSLSIHGIPSYLETSRRGGHMWLFFEVPIPGQDVRTFARGVMDAYDISDIEIFPKQDKLRGGPGSLIRLPFGIHRRTGKRYGFITENNVPIASSYENQIHILSSPGTVPEEAFNSFWTNRQVETELNSARETDISSGLLSDRVKLGIPVIDFVNQYVDLSSSGLGLCPFHDDQRRSFSVNIQENYWHCFAGCGGGSIINFWMKYRGADFADAVTELAGTLLY